MIQYQLIKVADPANVNIPKDDFWLDDPTVKEFYPMAAAEDVLTILVFKVRKDPGNLLGHLRRIHCCCINAQPDPLYAALLDMLVVLQGKGQALAMRMINASRKHLNQRQLAQLIQATVSPAAVPGNLYSVLTKGCDNTQPLISATAGADKHYDYLQLALDFIEFSQLEEAMDVLETGLVEQPSRQDLQDLLLELCQSTGNMARFKNFYLTKMPADAVLSEALLLDIAEWRIAS
ncbi:MAG: hypothetical protein ABSB19_00245 [Methylomonas sp.]|jgi:hypothetical protein